jgi:hypothetical protein
MTAGNDSPWHLGAAPEGARGWPASTGLFARAKDDGRAEAALIAVAGLNREAKAAAA